MSDLPDPANIRHDGCNDIIEAWQNGRLIDVENIDYEAAWSTLIGIIVSVQSEYSKVFEDDISRWTTTIVDAALGIKETTT